MKDYCGKQGNYKMSRRIFEINNKIPSYLEPCRRSDPRSEPMQHQAEAEFTFDGRKYRAKILDVSLGGCKLETAAPLLEGSIIEFLFPINRRGQVVWAEAEKFGIKLID